jgi:TRAP-type C4-dicarboxylate transport system permease small subunit
MWLVVAVVGVRGTAEMKAFFLTTSRILDRVGFVALVLAAAGLVLMTCVVAYAVFGRYVLNSTPSWAEAASIMLMGWFIFLGAAVGVRERTHLGFDVLLYVLPPSGKSVLRAISDVVVFAFGSGMVVFGLSLVDLTWTNVAPTLGVSGAFSYFPLVAGGLLISLFALERFCARLAGLPVDDDLPELQPEAHLAPREPR